MQMCIYCTNLIFKDCLHGGEEHSQNFLMGANCGLGDGSPPAGSGGIARWGSWGKAPKAKENEEIYENYSNNEMVTSFNNALQQEKSVNEAWSTAFTVVLLV